MVVVMSSFDSRKRGVRREAERIESLVRGIVRSVDLRYGVVGGYTDDEVRDVAVSLVRVRVELERLRGGL
jgi:hypothetical protein